MSRSAFLGDPQLLIGTPRPKNTTTTVYLNSSQPRQKLEQIGNLLRRQVAQQQLRHQRSRLSIRLRNELARRRSGLLAAIRSELGLHSPARQTGFARSTNHDGASAQNAIP